MATVPPDAPVPPLKDTPAPALTSQTAAAPTQPIGSDPVVQSAAVLEHPASIEATAQTAPSTAEHPHDAAPTSTIDPNVPSSESAPTALPTNPNTHPKEQQEAIKHEHPEVVGREKEKTKAAEREVKGEKPEGTVVKGIEDDRLYSMLRRFDESQRKLETSGLAVAEAVSARQTPEEADEKQVGHVLHPAHKLPPTEPDLRVSPLPNLPSHSDTLKTNLERVIAAVGPSGLRGAREAGRLMDWSPQERWRTGSYCVAYFICWIFGYTLLGVFSFFAILTAFPGTRRFLFPAVPPPPFTPPSATDPTNKRGDESLLGNVDSKVVHRSKAEQAEEQAFEARSILQAYTTRLVFDGSKKGKNKGNSAVGEKDLEESDDESDDIVDSKDGMTNDSAKAGASNVNHLNDHKDQGLQSADVIIGGEKIKMDEEMSEKKKKKIARQEAKRKRDEMVSTMIKGTEQGLGAFADFMERMQNAVSPPSAYPDRLARFKLAGAFIVPPALLLTFVPAWMFGRAATFFFGVGFWGQPLFKMGAEKFVELVPNWKDYLDALDMRNSILSGVPTDAQLTLHLLRVAEALGSPLPRPPPPPLAGTPKEAIKDSTPADLNADDDAEIEEAMETGSQKDQIMTQAKVKTKSHILGAFRSVGKKMAGFKGDVAIDGTRKQASPSLADNLQEQIGSKIDRMVFKGNVKDHGEIDSFPAKLNGESGHIILEGRNDILTAPQISFVPIAGKSERFVWPLDDIVEIKKAHVSMPRIALGWASGADVEGLGLTVRFKPVAMQVADLDKTRAEEKDDGTTMHFTRVGRREQLFVRMISMGAQRWEML